MQGAAVTAAAETAAKKESGEARLTFQSLIVIDEICFSVLGRRNRLVATTIDPSARESRPPITMHSARADREDYRDNLHGEQICQLGKRGASMLPWDHRLSPADAYFVFDIGH